ncbi:MAG: RluA family pseudouridine synthase [Polyangia bacterium]
MSAPSISPSSSGSPSRPSREPVGSPAHPAAHDPAERPEPGDRPRRDEGRFELAPEAIGQTVAAIVRAELGVTWGAARTLCERGKVFVDGQRLLDPAVRLRPGSRVLEVRPREKVPLAPHRALALASIVYEDSQVVIVDKPAGMSSVPYERGETGTAMDWVREAWRAQGKRGAKATGVPLHIVHRIDKDTSGLLLFAKTKQAERSLQLLWRQHDIERRYLCVVHGRLTDRTIESHFIEDRGDGLRGSAGIGPARATPSDHGKHAVTHVKALEFLGNLATLCSVTLETGKTHQIRIHAAEAGHPVVGESVYIRDFTRRGHEPLPSSRLLLHAESLGFVHPVTGEKIALRRPPPDDFQNVVRKLRALSARSEQAP